MESQKRSVGVFAKAYGTTRALVLLSPWLAYLLVADAALSFLLPLKLLAPKAVYHASSIIAESVWAWIQAIFVRLNRADLTVQRRDRSRSPASSSGSGSDSDSKKAQFPTGESVIVIANHVSWADFYLIQEVAQQAGMLGRCRWFAKRALRWVPFLGWGLWAMGMPLVSRRWTSDRAELDRIFAGLVKDKLPVSFIAPSSALLLPTAPRILLPLWDSHPYASADSDGLTHNITTGLVSYSEGTRYTPSKRAAAVSWCEKNGKSLGRNVLYPRPRGFVATVKTLRKSGHVRAVYDFTLAYARGTRFMSAPSFWDTLATPDLAAAGWRFFAGVDRFDIADLPEDEAGLTSWLEKRWVEKGERLESLRKSVSQGHDWPQADSVLN